LGIGRRLHTCRTLYSKIKFQDFCRDSNALYPAFDFWVPWITVGFVGFYAGSFCLPQKTRWAGSLLLLVLGLGVLYGISCSDFYIDGDDVFYFSDLWMPLTIGGIIPAAIHFLRQTKQ
jgi:hypothetical protein